MTTYMNTMITASHTAEPGSKSLKTLRHQAAFASRQLVLRRLDRAGYEAYTRGASAGHAGLYKVYIYKKGTAPAPDQRNHHRLAAGWFEVRYATGRSGVTTGISMYEQETEGLAEFLGIQLPSVDKDQTQGILKVNDFLNKVIDSPRISCNH